MEQVKNNSTDQDENIGKVRELLFGTEIKRHQAEVDSLRTEIDTKINEMKKQFNAQFESLKNMITRQGDTLTSMVQKIESSSDEKYVLTGKKISEANERNLKTFESISKNQSKEIGELEKSLRSEIDKLSTDTQRDISILREIKMNRSMLGKFFQEAADKLQVKK